MPAYPLRLRNPLTRPVEIHRAGGVEVLAPGGELLLAAPDPAAERLAAMGLLTRHAVPPPAAPLPPAAPAAPAVAERGAARTKTAPRRGRAHPVSGETP